MSGIEMVLWVSVGVTILLGIAAIITFVFTKLNAKEIDSMKIVYLGKMSNTDTSIQDAVKFMKLTNGIGGNLSERKTCE